MYEHEIREERDGMVWMDTGGAPGQPNSRRGYWISKNLAAAREAAGDAVTISLTCRLCKRVPSALRKTVKADLNKWGVCTECVITWIDGDPEMHNLLRRELLPKIMLKRERIEAQIRAMPAGEAKTFLMKRYRLESPSDT